MITLTTLPEIQAAVTAHLSDNDKYRGCYFWDASGTSAFQRRYKEFGKQVSFTFEEKVYLLQRSLSVSCKNYYYRSSVYVNGNRSNAASLNKIVKG